MSTSGKASFPATIPATVPSGGTGDTTLTAHAVLLGEGTSNVAFATPGASGQVLTSTGATSDPAFQAAAGGGAGGLAVYGDGSDGSPTFDGSTVVLGVTPSSNTYTMNRDWFLNAPTINSGVTINTNGFRLHVAGACTNNGTIAYNGNNAAVGVAGAALTPSATLAATTIGGAGATGSTTTGSNGTSETISLGGAGGAGGSGTGGAGGSGGTATAPAANAGTIRGDTNAYAGLLLTPTPINSGSTTVTVHGGGGGGSGGGDGTISGAGGGGGGGVWVAAKTFAGTGAIQARGGNGGTPAAGNRGGGGGGGGGWVLVISSSVSAGAITGQTIDANGGAFGTGSGTGTNGVVGSAGTVILLVN